ncbi:MAG: replicative DNA helicase [Alphaproteobacteria bacterium]
MSDAANNYPALRAVVGGTNAPPPYNIEAEQAMLGALLVNNQVYFKVFETVSSDDFYDPIHQRLYAAISKTIDSGRVADPKTLRAQFENEGGLKHLGGAAYLADMAASVITLINAEDYAKLINEHATRRRLIAFSHEVLAIAHDHTSPPASSEALIGQAETKLFKIAEHRGQEGAVDMTTAFNQTMDNIEQAMKSDGKLSGVPSGLAKLDEILGGFEAGKLYVIAGRPAMGKTAIGLTIAVNATQAGAKTLFYSHEMERPDIVKRIIARVTGIPANKQRGQLSMEEFGKIYETRKEINLWPLYIDDSTRLKVSQIRGRAIRQKRRYGLDLIVIDYLGLMGVSDPNMNRNYQIEEITTGLKQLAKELKIPVILLAQLNRDLEKREDKRPMLSDLRDSGAVEQDSDVVMFVYRHEYYITRSEPVRGGRESDEAYAKRVDQWEKEVAKSRGKGELIIAKHRQGVTGTVNLMFRGMRCMFSDAEVDEAHP